MHVIDNVYTKSRSLHNNKNKNSYKKKKTDDVTAQQPSLSSEPSYNKSKKYVKNYKRKRG